MRHNHQATTSTRRCSLRSWEAALGEMQIVGRGIYSFARAAEISGVPVASLRQWTLGRQRHARSISSRPVVHLDIPALDGEQVLSFINLIEVKLIGEFRRLRLPLQYIRQVVDVLEQSYDVTHPLACHRLQTDGKSIFAEIDELGQFACIEIAGRRPNHVVIEEVVRPLFKNVDFAGNLDLAHRWYPLGRSGGVVVDPEKAFGEPVLVVNGIPTRALARQVTTAGDSIEDVAGWYEVPVSAVATAVTYEGSLRRKAA